MQTKNAQNSKKQTAFALQPGMRVVIADDIEAVVEEVIFARNMLGAILLVEYWLDERLITLRVHASDVRPVNQQPARMS